MNAILFLLIAQATPFQEQVAKRFPKWDLDCDRTLSPTEIDRLVVDSAIKGEEAAALGVIKSILRGKKWELPPLTFDYFLSRGGTKEAHPSWDPLYVSALGRIRKANRTLFEKGAPSLDAFHQGKLGDCFFLAPLGAAIHRDSAAVRRWIEPCGDAGYDVAFPGAKKFRIEPLTDAELVLTSTTENEGVWLAVLEKAAGAVRNEKAPPEKRRESFTDLIARGGSTAPMIALLTGRNAKRVSKPSVEKVRDLVKSAMKDRRLVCCTTPKSSATPGVAAHHAYAVLAYDEKNDALLLFNPWGNAFKPKGKPGLQNGYPVLDGRFTVPVADFVRIFSGVSYEAER